MNIDISTVVSFLGGLGVGSVVSAIVQHRLSRVATQQNNLFAERKSAFDGLLVSYASLAEGWTDSKAKNFALCEARIQLVGSEATVVALGNLKASEPGAVQRDLAHQQLIKNMRKDLGLA